MGFTPLDGICMCTRSGTVDPGSMIASLGGIDVLVFTDAIGESEPKLRAQAWEAFRYCGLRINPELNDEAQPDAVVSSADSAVAIAATKGREDWQIAREAFSVFAGMAQPI